jgi:hypothetical protein
VVVEVAMAVAVTVVVVLAVVVAAEVFCSEMLYYYDLHNITHDFIVRYALRL